MAGCGQGQKETRLSETRTQSPYSDARAHGLRGRYCFGLVEEPPR
jgi:hypothetical protein